MAQQIIDPAGIYKSTDRDEQANREIAAILSELPPDHLARRAFARGRATADITSHLPDRRDLTCKLMNASWDYYRRARPRRGRGGSPLLR
jgi:hypothetical protein